MGIIPPLITILALLIIMLLGQQTRLGARDALIMQTFGFGAGEEFYLKVIRLGVFLRVKCRILPSKKITVCSIERNGVILKGICGGLFFGLFRKTDNFRVHVEVHLSDSVMRREFCKGLMAAGYTGFSVSENIVKFTTQGAV